MMVRRVSTVGSAVLLCAALVLPLTRPSAARAAPPIDHIIVIYQENHSFDNLYGKFPGAIGLDRPEAPVLQVDKNGAPFETLPQPIDTEQVPPVPDLRFPTELPNRPFLIDEYVHLDHEFGSPVHRFYQHQLQIDGGKLDKYVAWTNAGGIVMGYHDTSTLPTYVYAREYTLMDNFFHAAFGGSFLNHFWLICACSPTWPDAPADIVAQPQLDPAGRVVDLPKDGIVTPDGYAVNTAYPRYGPHPSNLAEDRLLPPQTMPTIGERLSVAGVSWAWYAGGWDDALAGRPDKNFKFHHQPFAFHTLYAGDASAGRQHVRDELEFFAALQQGTLPAVSFIKPIGDDDEHPGYTDVHRGQQHVVDIIERVQGSSYWQSTAIIVTYDEFGGYFDHVPPPVVDRWGPGNRVPTLVISPYARRGFIDHTLYDTTSILKFIEWRFGLLPLGERDAAAANLLAAFDFGPE